MDDENIMRRAVPKFEKQTYGAVVATILETENSIVEVQERNDGAYGLTIHRRHEDRDVWEDISAYLKAEHFEALGSVARRMRGEPECCRGLAPITECYCERNSAPNSSAPGQVITSRARTPERIER